MQAHYFTFGADHSLPDGRPAKDEFVIVHAKDRHREVFMGWLGSNAFASEYTAEEWFELDMARHYPPVALAAVSIEVWS